MRWQLGVYFLALSFMLGAASKAPAEDLTFTTIDFPDATSTTALDINPRGDIVGRYTTADGVTHGYLLSEGVFTSIDFPNATRTVAHGINPRGDIVGLYKLISKEDCGLTGFCDAHGFLLSGGEFTTVDFPGSIASFAQGINPSGDIVGRYRSTDGQWHGYLQRGDEFTSLDFPGAIFATLPTKINARGDLVGEYVPISPFVLRGFLLSNGEFISIDVPGATLTNANGINPQGDIVGRYDMAGVTHGYLLSENIFTPIDVPGATSTIARAINARGDIVGFYTAAGKTHGFLLSR